MKPEWQMKIIRQFRDGFLAGLNRVPRRPKMSDHWQAGYIAGSKNRKVLDKVVTSYLEEVTNHES